MRRMRTRARRGFALIDAIVGGVMLGAGLAVVLSLLTRSLGNQTTGEKRLVAAWLCDELLSSVLIDGPREFSRTNDSRGRFDPPFEEFGFEIQLEDLGRGNPWRAVAIVRWGDRERDEVRVETLVAPRLGDPEQPREPEERVDREERYFGDDQGS